jgi:hypothetical protein
MSFYFVYFTPISTIFSVNKTHIAHIWYTFPTYSFTQLGTVLVITIESFRDVFLMLAEIALNAVSIYYLRKYFKNRLELINGTNRNITALELNHTGLHTTNESSLNHVDQGRRANNALSTANMRATIMSLVMCTLSVLEHISLTACVVYPYFGSSFITGNFVCFGGVFSIGLKHSLNFFVFYFFNKRFAERLHSMLKIILNLKLLFQNRDATNI